MPDHRRNRLRILIPIATVGALGTAPAMASAEDVEVHEGDTLWNLTAARYGADIDYSYVAAVAAANEIPDPNLILVGDVLSMPRRAQLDLRAVQEPAEAAPEPSEREPGTDWDGDGVVEPEPSDDGGSGGGDDVESSEVSDSSDEPDVSGGSDTGGVYWPWDVIAQCESGGNWAADTGNGYYGGLQFAWGSWEAVGGSGNPAHASPSEQVMRAEMLKDLQGFGAWPTCRHAAGV